MSQNSGHEARCIVVIGGGVSGLTAALRLSQSLDRASVLLLESRDRVGGVINTVVRDGFVVEEAADSFVFGGHAGLQELCRLIDIEQYLVPANVHCQRAMVMYRDRLQPVPPGLMLSATPQIWPLLTSRLLSLVGKIRVLLEPFVARRRECDDESIAQFISRRLGTQPYDRLVRPIADAIYGADPARLSAAATIPRLVDIEKAWGSLFLGFVRERGTRKIHDSMKDGATRSGVFSPRDGMSSFIDALSRQLAPGSIQLNSPVMQLIRRNDSRWGVVLSGESPRLLVADAVVVAAPAYEAAAMLKNLSPTLAAELRSIEYASRINVTLGYEISQLTTEPVASGYFFPRSFNRRVRSVSVASAKFPFRAPQDKYQMRVSLADERGDSFEQRSDDELAEAAAKEVSSLLSIRGTPSFQHVTRHSCGTPKYTLGHVGRVTRITRLVGECRGLALAGAAYRGAAVPQCVQSGEQAAEVIQRYLA